MATKSKLEKAIDEQADKLNHAQAELVRSQYETYMRNKRRMAELDQMLKAANANRAVTREEIRALQAERSTIAYEYNQLSTANSRIQAELFNQLSDEERR